MQRVCLYPIAHCVDAFRLQIEDRFVQYDSTRVSNLAVYKSIVYANQGKSDSPPRDFVVLFSEKSRSPFVPHGTSLPFKRVLFTSSRFARFQLPFATAIVLYNRGLTRSSRGGLINSFLPNLLNSLSAGLNVRPHRSETATPLSSSMIKLVARMTNKRAYKSELDENKGNLSIERAAFFFVCLALVILRRVE